MPLAALSPVSSAILRHATRAAILRADDAFEALLSELKDAYTRAWTAQVREGIIAALDALRDLGPGAYTQADGETIMRALEGRIGPDAITAAMREPAVRLSDMLWRLGPKEIGSTLGVDIGFMRADLEALELVKDANLFWLGQNWNTWTDGMFRSALSDYFTIGMTREQLANRFQDDFIGLGERGAHYWELLADHTATKTREIGRITGYERAAVTAVQIRAHIDDNTTPFCRAAHNRIVLVADQRIQANTYLDCVRRRDVDGAKSAWPMHPDASAIETLPADALPLGTATPPFHFRCRTITVAYFGPLPTS